MHEQTRLVLSAVIPVFGIIGIGLLMRKLDWLTEEADQSLLRVTLNLLFPCLILDKLLGNSALAGWSNLGLPPILGFGTVALGMAMALGSRWLTGLNDARAVRTFAVTVGIYNYTYVPLPLATNLFGDRVVGVLLVYALGAEFAMWTLGVMLFKGSGARDWRKVMNAPVVTIILAVVLNWLGFELRAGNPVRVGLNWLGACAVPMALVLIGAVVADHLRMGALGRSGWRVVGAAILLRIMVLPIVFLLVASYLVPSEELKRVLILQAAMGSAVFPILLARRYGGDPQTALRVVLGTSAVALLTIPVWIRVGRWLLGV